MKESVVRKWHRRMGVALALFIILQVGTGLVLTIGERVDTQHHAHARSVSPSMQDHHDHGEDEPSVEQHGLTGVIHHSGGAVGFVYRFIVGFGTIGIVVSGGFIFLKTRVRPRRR
jgi:hypothetical protein